MFLRQRAFRGKVHTEQSDLYRVLHSTVIPVSQFHVENTGHGITKFGGKSPGKEIRISQHVTA